MEAASIPAVSPGQALAPGKRGLKRGLKDRERTVILACDESIITETPPLRACWAPLGQRAEVPITGNRDKRVLYATLNVRSGALCMSGSTHWNQQGFQAHLCQIRRMWRGWRIVLFLDRGSPHTSRASRALARQLGIELRFLPTATPELNPVEGLWCHGKADVVANEPTPNVDISTLRLCAYLLGLSNHQRLQMAGAVSQNFWLAA